MSSKEILNIMSQTVCGNCKWAIWGDKKDDIWFDCGLEVVEPNNPIGSDDYCDDLDPGE